MPIYYRADKRPPNFMFKLGFKSREELVSKPEDWWPHAIAAPLSNRLGTLARMVATDAISKMSARHEG